MNQKRGKDYDADDDSDTAPSVDSTGKRKSFRRLIVRFAEKTSMQGVPYINNAKLIGAKIIWSVLLLAALVALGIHLWYLFTQYYDWPKQTKVELGFANLRFPDVTICNTNPIHKGRLDDTTGVKQLKSLISDLNPRNLVPDQFDANYDPLAGMNNNNNNNNNPPPTTVPPAPPQTKRKKRFVQQYDNLNLADYNENFESKKGDNSTLDSNEYNGEVSTSSEIREVFEELYMDLPKNQRATLGHQMSDMLLECTFNGRQCGPKLFRLHQTSEYGNCWVLSSNKFSVQNSGPSGGLSLILYLEVQEYLKGLTTGYGVRIQIHEPSTIPYPAEEGLFIPSSMETDVGLKMTIIDRLDGNYGDCDDGAVFTGNYDKKYTRRACQRICEMNQVIKQCGCFADVHEEIALQKSNNTHKPCRSSAEKRCEDAERRKFDMKMASCPCPNPCREVQYQKALSSRQWPNDDYAFVLLQGICTSKPAVCATLRKDIGNQRIINNNFLKLNIYYEDLNFQNITEEPEIALAQFLSDVGGAVGLWIGLSILSICEVLQLLVELCDYFAHRTIRRREREQRRASRRMQQAKAASNPQKSISKEADKHSNHSHRKDITDSPKSSSKYLDIDLGNPLGRRSPRQSPHVNRLKDARGYDSDNVRRGSGDKRSNGLENGRGLRYDDDYFRRNYMMGY